MTAGCETTGGIRNGQGALELGKHRKTLTQTNENPKKSVSRSHEQVRIIDSKTGRKSAHKSMKNRPKTSENRRKIDFGSLWALWVVPRRFLFLVEQRKNGLRAPIWVVLGAKLAVLAAMLAVLGAMLAARDGPNGARKRPRGLFERGRKLERRPYRFFVAFWYDCGKPEPQFSSASAVFRTLRTKLAPSAPRRRKTTKIDVFRSPKSSPGASKQSSGGLRRAQRRARTSEVSPNFQK